MNGSTLTYFNEDTFQLEIWNIDDVSLLNYEMEIKKGAPIVSIPYADLWHGLSWSKWKPENENELSQIREKVKQGLDNAKEKIVFDFLDSFNKVKK